MDTLSPTEKRELLLREFSELLSQKNSLPPESIDVVYVFSGVEKFRLIGSSLDRLRTGIDLWKKLSKSQMRPPVFLFQGSAAWLDPVQRAFDNKTLMIDSRYRRLVLVNQWNSTLDQFLRIPKELQEKKSWMIVTSPWHLPRVRRYAKKYWPDIHVWFWTSPYRKLEFEKYSDVEIKKIIRYVKKGDFDL